MPGALLLFFIRFPVLSHFEGHAESPISLLIWVAFPRVALGSRPSAFGCCTTLQLLTAAASPFDTSPSVTPSAFLLMQPPEKDPDPL